MNNSFIKKAYPYLFLFIVIIIGYWCISFFIYPLKYDAVNFYLPFRNFYGSCFQNGVSPFWLPYQSLGYPSFSDTTTGVFYPLVWIIGYLWGYNIYSLSFEYILHIYIASIGFYLLSKELGFDNKISILLAICYCFSGFFIGNSQHFSKIIFACWLPISIYYFIKIIVTIQQYFKNIFKNVKNRHFINSC